jgi:hypothetical protein
MSTKSLIVATLVVGAGLLSACGPDATDFTEPGGQSVAQQAIAPAIAVQARNVDRIMGIDGVVGTGVALDADGRPVIKIFTQVPGVTGIPERLEGVPVNVEVTGMFVARQDPSTRFLRPVPIGVSTGHPEITAGTIGARVTDGTEVYILSNRARPTGEQPRTTSSAGLRPGSRSTSAAATTSSTRQSRVPALPILDIRHHQPMGTAHQDRPRWPPT